MKHTLKGPGGITLELDSNQIFPNDPGQGTPALVVWPNGNTGTFYCVTAEGENVEGDRLTDEQARWLNSQEESVDLFIESMGREIPDEATTT